MNPLTNFWQQLRRVFDEKPRPPREIRLAHFMRHYEGRLEVMLNVLEKGLSLEALPMRYPIYFDDPDEYGEDLLIAANWKWVDSRLEGLRYRQRDQARAGAWLGLHESMVMQPSLVTKIAQQVHDVAARLAMVAEKTNSRPLVISAASVLFLATLNNVLCLYDHLIPAWEREGVSWGKRQWLRFKERTWLRVFGRAKRQAQRNRLEQAIQTGFNKLVSKCKPQAGDLLFFHLSVAALQRLWEQAEAKCTKKNWAELWSVLPHLKRLMDLSAFSFALDLNARLWENASAEKLRGVELLLDNGCPFDFITPAAQRWVEALVTARNKDEVFKRIETMKSYLLPSTGASSETAFSITRLAGQKCFIKFARLLIRNWPEEYEDQGGQMRAASWHNIFTRVRDWVQRDLNGPLFDPAGQPALSPAEREALGKLIEVTKPQLAPPPPPNPIASVVVPPPPKSTPSVAPPVMEVRPAPKIPWLPLRSTAAKLSMNEVKRMLREGNFFDHDLNNTGKGWEHQYEMAERSGQKLVIDHATGLIWQRAGSSYWMSYFKTQEYITGLNRQVFGGFCDWRLPTLEEAMSLMEPQKKASNLFIAPVFEHTQQWIWTADWESDLMAWVVSYNTGSCYNPTMTTQYAVRAVRSGISAVPSQLPMNVPPSPTTKPVPPPTPKPVPAPPAAKAQPLALPLRSQPLNTLSIADVQKMLRERNFFEKVLNKAGQGLHHYYELLERNGQKLVIDHATGLMWQQSCSHNLTKSDDVRKYIRDLNSPKFGGYDNWRVPTLEEAMSLMERTPRNGNLYLDPVFSQTPEWSWTITADWSAAELVWLVIFYQGSCLPMKMGSGIAAVRAVRSVDSY